MTILYIHGFASTGNSPKADTLRAMFPGQTVLSPSLAMQPQADFDRLCHLAETHGVTTVVGTSLGGFYALALAQTYDLRLVLINPAIDARNLLEPRGMVPIYGTDVEFLWNAEQVQQLREIQKTVTDAVNPKTSTLTWKHVLVLLGAKDDVIHHEVTAAAFPYANVVVDAEADHRFLSAISGYEDTIRALVALPLDTGFPPIED